MIKVGDWVTHNITNERFEIIEYNDKYVWLRKGNGYREITTHETLYKWLYVEQKQSADELERKLNKEVEDSYQMENRWRTEIERADELEKRWSELVDVLKKKYEYYKVRADDESVGPIEQGKWKIAKHELMMVLKIMTDLKRGETE